MDVTLAEVDRAVRRGLRPPCPVCARNTLKIGKIQQAENGDRGITYTCSTPDCKLGARFVVVPWWTRIHHAATSRLVQASIAAIMGISVGGFGVWAWNAKLFGSSDKSAAAQIEVFQKTQDALPYVGKLIANAKKDDVLTFAGLNFHIVVNDRDDEIVEAVQRGVWVRFLIAPPTRDVCETHARRFAHDSAALMREAQQCVRDLQQIEARLRAAASPGAGTVRFEIRVYAEQPIRRSYHLRSGEKTESIEVPYLDGVRSTDSVVIRIPPGSPLSKCFETSVDALWDRGIKLSDWLKSNPGVQLP